MPFCRGAAHHALLPKESPSASHSTAVFGGERIWRNTHVKLLISLREYPFPATGVDQPLPPIAIRTARAHLPCRTACQQQQCAGNRVLSDVRLPASIMLNPFAYAAISLSVCNG